MGVCARVPERIRTTYGGACAMRMCVHSCVLRVHGVSQVVSMGVVVVRLYRGKGARQYIGAEELTTYLIPIMCHRSAIKPQRGTLLVLI